MPPNQNLPTVSSRQRDLLGRVVALPAAAVLFALIRKAWFDIDLSWDSLAYHLPCAGLRVGIFSQNQYHFSKWINAVNDGFPVLPDYIQGVLWWLTGRPQAANLLNMLGLLTCITVLKMVFRIPLAYSMLSFFAIPVVLIESTSAYNDVFGNSFIAIMLVLIFSALVRPHEFSVWRFLGVLVAFAIAANVKLGFVLAGTAGLFSLVIVFVLNRHGFTLLSATWRSYSRLVKAALIFAGCMLLLTGFANEVKDALVFHNPIYPIALRLGPRTLPGYPVAAETDPLYLSQSPPPVRWALSLLEYKAFEGRNPLWTLAQGDVPLASPALRMGGFFAPIVLFNILWLLLLQIKLRSRFGFRPLWFVVVMSVVTSFFPGSQESRYYLYWALTLIAVNLYLIVNYLTGDEGTNARVLYIGTMASFLVFVLCATGFVYVRANHLNPKRVAQLFGTTKELSGMHLQPGEGVCVIGKNPRSFLYSPLFNPGLESESHYHVFEAYVPADCMGTRIVP